MTFTPFLRVKKIPPDPAIALLVIYPEETDMCSSRQLSASVYSRFIHDLKAEETASGQGLGSLGESLKG